jgi:hypothetical protein
MIMLFTFFTAVDALPSGSPICHYDKAKVSAAHPEMTFPRGRAVTYHPGSQSFKVRITGNNKLKGFLMYVEDENGLHIGEFKPNPVAKAVKNCYGGLSTITHVDSDPKNLIEFDWIGTYSGKASLVMVLVHGDGTNHLVDREVLRPADKKYVPAPPSKPTESPNAGPKADAANLGPNSPNAGKSAQSAPNPKNNAYEEPCEEDPTLPCEEETPTPASETALPAAADEVYSNSAIFANILSLMLLFLQ